MHGQRGLPRPAPPPAAPAARRPLPLHPSTVPAHLQKWVRLRLSAMSSTHTAAGGSTGMQLSLISRKRWLSGSRSASRSSARSASICGVQGQAGS